MTLRPPSLRPPGPASVTVVTGVSGAGKSTAVNALEDLGFFCVDNLPTPVMASTVDALTAAGLKRIAFGIDVRVRGFLDDAAATINELSKPGERNVEVRNMPECIAHTQEIEALARKGETLSHATHQIAARSLLRLVEHADARIESDDRTGWPRQA